MILLVYDPLSGIEGYFEIDAHPGPETLECELGSMSDAAQDPIRPGEIVGWWHTWPASVETGIPICRRHLAAETPTGAKYHQVFFTDEAQMRAFVVELEADYRWDMP